MKYLLLLLFIVSSTAQATTVVFCQSEEKVEGWVGHRTSDYIYFNAVLVSDKILSQARIDGAFQSESRDVEAHPDYKPVSPRYRNYNKFSPLEDAWHWFAPLFPKDLPTRSKTFDGYIQIHSEAGYLKTVTLHCDLQTKESES